MTVLLTVVAALTGRGAWGTLLVALTVGCGQLTIGWINDLVDEGRDRAAGRSDKPLALGRVSRRTVLRATVVASVLVVPLSLLNGVAAGLAHLGFVLGAWAYDLVLKPTVLSWLPYVVSFGLLPAFVSFGGRGPGVFGGQPAGPPTVSLTVLAALFGAGVHVLNTLPDLEDDERTGVRHLPLLLAHRFGGRALLVVSGLGTVAVAAAMVIAALSLGVRR